MDTLPAVPQTSHAGTLLDEAAMLLHGLRFATHRSVALNGSRVAVSVAAWGTTDDGAAYVGLPGDETEDVPPEQRSRRVSEVLVTCRPRAPFAPRDLQAAGVPVFLLPDAQQGDGWFGRFDAYGRVVFQRVPPGRYRLSVSASWVASNERLVTTDSLRPLRAPGQRKRETKPQQIERFRGWRDTSYPLIEVPDAALSLGESREYAQARAAITAAQLQLAAFRGPIVIEAARGALRAVLTPHLSERNLEITFSVARRGLRRPLVRFAFVDARSHAVYRQAEVQLTPREMAAGEWAGRWYSHVSLPAPSEFVAQVVDEDSDTDSSANGPSGSDMAK